VALSTWNSWSEKGPHGPCRPTAGRWNAYFRNFYKEGAGTKLWAQEAGAQIYGLGFPGDGPTASIPGRPGSMRFMTAYGRRRAHRDREVAKLNLERRGIREAADSKALPASILSVGACTAGRLLSAAGALINWERIADDNKTHFPPR